MMFGFFAGLVSWKSRHFSPRLEYREMDQTTPSDEAAEQRAKLADGRRSSVDMHELLPLWDPRESDANGEGPAETETRPENNGGKSRLQPAADACR